MNRPEIVLVYDGECPACDAYSRAVRIRESVGDLRIVDAREQSDALDEITAKGLDIDQGIVLKIGTRLYHGPDALHALALISSRSGVFNRLNYRIFRSKTLSSGLYPVLRFFRNLLLRIRGKTGINNRLEIPGGGTASPMSEDGDPPAKDDAASHS
jgi:predicted DCC family thiol-disulfide oxidoreductase YuxK